MSSRSRYIPRGCRTFTADMIGGEENAAKTQLEWRVWKEPTKRPIGSKRKKSGKVADNSDQTQESWHRTTCTVTDSDDIEPGFEIVFGRREMRRRW